MNIIPGQITKTISKIVLYSVLVFMAFIMIGPFVWTLSTSLKTGNIFSYPPQLIPSNPSIKHYVTAWTSVPYFRYLVNSILVTGITVVLNVIIGSLAGYALAWMEFKGKTVIFIFIISTMMIPTEVTMIPVYLILNRLGWLDTYIGLIIPFSVTGFNVFLFRQFFATVPRQLGEAAQIDGCNSLGIYWKILLPVCKPVIASVSIITFVWSWNQLLWPLIITRTPTMATIPLGLARMQSVFSASWAVVAAASIISIIPTVIVFLFLQKWFIQGFVAGSIKG